MTLLTDLHKLVNSPETVQASNLINTLYTENKFMYAKTINQFHELFRLFIHEYDFSPDSKARFRREIESLIS